MNDMVAVLGATGGVGRALAERLKSRGVPVFLIGRDREALAALGRDLGAEHAVADALEPDALESAVAAAARAGSGRLGGLACCIGSIVMKPLKSAAASDYADAFALNVIAPAIAVKTARAALAAAKGSAVLFSSVAARAGFPNHAVIGSVKAAVEGLTVALAAELAPDIRVNCLAPSLTDTKMARGLTGNAAMATALAKLHPLGRLGTAEDQAAAAAFLLSPEAGWITGQILGVDGGRGAIATKG